MNENDQKIDEDPEFQAMRVVHQALSPLDDSARQRVLQYVMGRLGMRAPPARGGGSPREEEVPPEKILKEDFQGEIPIDYSDELDSISPVALKWMKRSGIFPTQLSQIFSIQLDEIDLVATKVPGKSKRERVQNVFRLVAIAEYLASGAARVSHEDLKEACLHYDAYDVANHSKNLKSLGRELSGSKESGYTLTATGITSATNLIKEMTSDSS